MQSHATESNTQVVVAPARPRITRLPDPRLHYRLERILECMSKAPGQSIPQISADGAEGKAAYRFLGFLG